MFAQRRAGHSLARITRALNDACTPCPSAADPQRNPHHPAAKSLHADAACAETTAAGRAI